MKYLILILTLSLAGLNAKEPKVVSQEEDTPNVVIYGDSGNDLQEGYIKNWRWKAGNIFTADLTTTKTKIFPLSQVTLLLILMLCILYISHGVFL